MSIQDEISEPFEPKELSVWSPAQEAVLRVIQFVLNRPRVPQKEWALPESLHKPAMQKFEESMAIVEADYIASRQYDSIRKNDVENVESLGNHFPVSRHLPMDNPDTSQPTSTRKTRNTVDNVESVENVEFVASCLQSRLHRPPRPPQV